jgi:hypothetical protein
VKPVTISVEGPLNRAYVRRVNRKAMRRFKERLTTPGSLSPPG